MKLKFPTVGVVLEGKRLWLLTDYSTCALQLRSYDKNGLGFDVVSNFMAKWSEFRVTVCHALWSWRNEMVHDGNFYAASAVEDGGLKHFQLTNQCPPPVYLIELPSSALEIHSIPSHPL
ncbi:hypothetical protein TSUD_221640 [Trifolium subterraneum]|uniref:Uncharacterized protein n=1 Tax=Trifolium subterraneum TaxID=3900 RepID=A0A2Z6MMT1_TRISU|nr:hypothetical protein TSUD_221640 [Trifolium subterraneum]